ncbi:hypothetical protein J6I88_01155 [Acinetobacter baumannii]|nr:DUF6500 family protein [Acinetobacter baumannii]QTK77784.1 hypothetical protein J6I88_01155 [Acinetobacter baumannii]
MLLLDPFIFRGDYLSFYAFFKNKNDNPELLMEAAHWWIMEHKLDHFEKAIKIKQLVLSES